MDIETLKFSLKQKEEELGKLTLTTFVLNPDITRLTEEIASLKNQIAKMEEANDGK